MILIKKYLYCLVFQLTLALFCLYLQSATSFQFIRSAFWKSKPVNTKDSFFRSSEICSYLQAKKDFLGRGKLPKSSSALRDSVPGKIPQPPNVPPPIDEETPYFIEAQEEEITGGTKEEVKEEIKEEIKEETKLEDNPALKALDSVVGPLFKKDIEKDVSKDAIVGAAIFGAGTTLLASTSLLTTGLAGLAAAYVSINPGLAGDLTRVIGSLAWNVTQNIAEFTEQMGDQIAEKIVEEGDKIIDIKGEGEEEFLQVLQEAEKAIEIVVDMDKNLQFETVRVEQQFNEELIAMEEAKRAEEEKLAIERAEFERKVEEKKEAKRLALEKEKARIVEEERIAAEMEKIFEEERLAKEAAEEVRLAVEEAERIAEDRKIAELKAEEERLTEEFRILEEKLRAEEEAEERRLAAEKAEEEIQLAVEQQEEEGLAAQLRVIEEKRQAEEARIAEEFFEEDELAQQFRLIEERRLAEEKELEQEIAEEERLAEQFRLIEERRQAEEERYADETILESDAVIDSDHDEGLLDVEEWMTPVNQDESANIGDFDEDDGMFLDEQVLGAVMDQVSDDQAMFEDTGSDPYMDEEHDETTQEQQSGIQFADTPIVEETEQADPFNDFSDDFIDEAEWNASIDLAKKLDPDLFSDMDDEDMEERVKWEAAETLAKSLNVEEEEVAEPKMKRKSNKKAETDEKILQEFEEQLSNLEIEKRQQRQELLGEPKEPLVEVDYSKLTVPQLKDKLRSRGLKVSGRKAELIERLLDNE